ASSRWNCPTYNRATCLNHRGTETHRSLCLCGSSSEGEVGLKILIIGGTGLISTAITRQLLERGDDVTLYNRGKSEVRIPAGAKTIQGDRKDYAAFEAQMAEAGSFDC